MWFDVGIKRYTTPHGGKSLADELWFDVGIKRYTTLAENMKKMAKLWFDVGIKRYTTPVMIGQIDDGCGLM